MKLTIKIEKNIHISNYITNRKVLLYFTYSQNVATVDYFSSTYSHSDTIEESKNKIILHSN